MLFNTIEYFVFLPLVVLAYFSLRYRHRWILLLAASYFFYMCWKPEYIILIITSTLVDYVCGRVIGTSERHSVRRSMLLLSVLTNLSILGFFKYYHFAVSNIEWFFHINNAAFSAPELSFLLPVGISFYTFQTMSYTIDVYRGKVTPEKHIGYFSLYVSFFPQLVAGPIERPGRLLPQLHEDHALTAANLSSGIKLIGLGLFKKMVIADRLAIYVDRVYADPTGLAGFPLIIATFFFAYQIYCDFSGYTDIAIGSARILGIDLMQNFNSPYHSKSIREFWSRWHISLSTWFRDYVYIPLGGNKVREVRWIFNIMIVFMVSGLWHGASWTFVVWGAIHGVFMFLPKYVSQAIRGTALERSLHRLPQAVRAGSAVVFTFLVVLFAWVFFRAESVPHAFAILANMTDISTARLGVSIAGGQFGPIISLLSIVVLELYEIFGAKHLLPRLRAARPLVRWGVYYLAALAFLLFAVFESSSQFIYFQF